MKREITYEYCNCKEGESQYKDVDLTEGECVQARYIPARMEVDQGNPYIEALPLPASGKKARRANRKGIPGYQYEKVKDMSKLDKMLQVGLLREMRFPLTFQDELEFAFYNALLTSYRDRRQVWTDKNPVQCRINDEDVITDNVLEGSSSDATNAGFSLIGYSGSGKSSSISMLVSHCPQLIMHKDDHGEFPQIVYIVVNAVPNSNFSALYQGIGDAVDKALGNTRPVYAEVIAKARSLGEKQERVRELIEKFAIGILIFDEIQFVSFSSTKENSYEALLTLANRTKVALAVVGTEDAKAKMAPQLRMARRMGTMINTSSYCNSKRFFADMVKNIFHFQWFDEPVQVTDEIIETLYELTRGIVDELVGIYSAVNLDYLTYDEDDPHKPKINGAYIRKVTRKFYPGLQKVLKNIDKEGNDAEIAEMKENADAKAQQIIDQERQRRSEDEIVNEQVSDMAEEETLEKVKQMIQPMYPEYTDALLEPAFYKTADKMDISKTPIEDVARAVLDDLKKQPKRRVKKTKAVDKGVVRIPDYILDGRTEESSDDEAEGKKKAC